MIPSYLASLMASNPNRYYQKVLIPTSRSNQLIQTILMSQTNHSC
jgi:hypothetical protein